MHRPVGMLTIALVVGVAVGTVGTQILIPQQTAARRTLLQQQDLEGVAGKEIIMYHAEISPGGMAGRHTHPGPELAYVLEGTLIFELDGQPSVTLKAGESVHVPAQQIHNAKNGSTTAPVKVIVFMVGEKGQPLATPAQ
jgi:quercetin dioxygenase-like cupin family protein